MVLSNVGSSNVEFSGEVIKFAQEGASYWKDLSNNGVMPNRNLETSWLKIFYGVSEGRNLTMPETQEFSHPGKQRRNGI
ncbi:hypothetical protein NPIL_108061 [Nephila pilipes]|uniref:Uncharacterized protein n=1 Tax=Nephila pilipes TaxID=299642 RepID=A0A8X6N9N7_NEPPI|nr:hypothetical protein NPIL_108061 [Nephila pilipes]